MSVVLDSVVVLPININDYLSEVPQKPVCGKGKGYFPNILLYFGFHYGEMKVKKLIL